MCWLDFGIKRSKVKVTADDGPENRVNATIVTIDDDDDDDEIAYFTVRWKTRQQVLSTAPKTWDNTDKDSKNRKNWS